LCGLAKVAVPEGLTLDGVNVLPAWQGKKTVADRTWFTYEAQGNNTDKVWAATSDRWKLIMKGPALAATDPSVIKSELFDLANDPYETKDVLAGHHREAAMLMLKLNEFTLWGVDGIPVYSKGREGFTVPEDWIIQTE